MSEAAESLQGKGERSSQGEALLALTNKERNVVRLRYGPDGNISHTLKQVGEKLGLSRERVRQIESSAMRKLLALNDKEARQRRG